jgi:hypothetical protein
LARSGTADEPECWRGHHARRDSGPRARLIPSSGATQRRDNAQILVEADESDPTAAGNAVAALALLPATGALFHFMPSFLLSGFLFPYAGTPTWAQAIGNAIPVTHFCPSCVERF